MVAKVGSDLFGEATIKNFASFGIDTTHVQIVEGAPRGSRRFSSSPTVRTASSSSRARTTAARRRMSTRRRRTRRVDTIILQFEIPLETIYHTVRFARAHNIRCIVNPAPGGAGGARRARRRGLFHPERDRGRAHHRPAGAHARGGGGMRCGAARQGVSARGAHTRCARLVAGDAAGSTHVPPFPVAAVDTTGAGDAFIGSLAVFLAEGLPEQEAMARAESLRRPVDHAASARRNHFRGAPTSRRNGPGGTAKPDKNSATRSGSTPCLSCIAIRWPSYSV